MEITINKFVSEPAIQEQTVQEKVKEIMSILGKDGQLSINFISAEFIKKINAKYRGIRRITDVISFSLAEGKKIKGGEIELGDIFVCPQRIRKQAKENMISYEEELWRMITHGVLHLLGYDHAKKLPAKKMFALQEKILKKLL